MTAFLAATLVGFWPPARPAQPTDRHFWHAESIDPAQADAVFALWTDVARWPEFDTGLRSAELEAAGTRITAEGQRGSLVDAADGRRVRWRVTGFDAGARRYTFTSRLPLASLHVHRFVAPDARSITHEVWFSGLLAGFWSSRFGADFRRQLPAVVARVAALTQNTTS